MRSHARLIAALAFALACSHASAQFFMQNGTGVFSLSAGLTTPRTLTVSGNATVSGTNTGDQTAGAGLALSGGAFSLTTSSLFTLKDTAGNGVTGTYGGTITFSGTGGITVVRTGNTFAIDGSGIGGGGNFYTTGSVTVGDIPTYTGTTTVSSSGINVAAGVANFGSFNLTTSGTITGGNLAVPGSSTLSTVVTPTGSFSGTVPLVVASGDQSGNTGWGNISTVNIPAGGPFVLDVSSYVNMNSTDGTDGVIVQAAFTDENGNAQTVNLQYLSGVPNPTFNGAMFGLIYVQGGTTVTFSTAPIVGTGTLNYDCGFVLKFLH